MKSRNYSSSNTEYEYRATLIFDRENHLYSCNYVFLGYMSDNIFFGQLFI